MFHFVSFVSGLLFGLGLVLSKMADPGKVIAFLDFTGCGIRLAFVMAGAVGVGLAGFACARKTGKAWLGVSQPIAPCHTDRLAACRRQCGFRGQGGDLPAFARGPHWSLFQPASSRQPFSSFSCLPAWDCMHW